MSLEAMLWALKKADTDDPLAKLVLIGLADHADAYGRNAFPSRSTLAQYCGLSLRTIQNKLDELRDAGLITPGDQKVISHYRYKPVVYDLQLNTQPASEGCTRCTSEGCTSCTSSPSRGAADDSKECTCVHTNRPRTNTPLPPSAADAHCTRHETPNRRCRDCVAEQEATSYALAEEDRKERMQLWYGRLADIQNCGMCNEDGYIDGRLCRHDPDAAARTARGMALVREAMNK